MKNPFRQKIDTERPCAECTKTARFMLPDRHICGTHAYQYVVSNQLGAGPMPVMVGPEWGRHQKA